MRIAFIGCGQVGGALADRLQRLGHDVTLAARDAHSKSVQRLLARNPALKLATPDAAVRAADVVFLATAFADVDGALAPLEAALAGKVLVDCTNPVGPGLTHGLGGTKSGSEHIQALVPATRLVKAFTIYGFENFEDNSFPGQNVRPAMLFCGTDATAKQVVARLLTELGWEPVDTGGLEQALALEHMTLLWIRMVRVGGQSPHTVWARLAK